MPTLYPFDLFIYGLSFGLGFFIAETIISFIWTVISGQIVAYLIRKGNGKN